MGRTIPLAGFLAAFWAGADASVIGQKPFWKWATPNSFEGGAVNPREVALNSCMARRSLYLMVSQGRAFLKERILSAGVVLCLVR